LAESGDSELVFDELEVDDEFRAHVAERRHFVRSSEVLEVLLGRPIFLDNADPDQDHRAPVMMVGETVQGRLLIVPIEPTGRPGVWRAVTAYQASLSERRRYEEELENDGE